MEKSFQRNDCSPNKEPPNKGATWTQNHVFKIKGDLLERGQKLRRAEKQQRGKENQILNWSHTESKKVRVAHTCAHSTENRGLPAERPLLAAPILQMSRPRPKGGLTKGLAQSRHLVDLKARGGIKATFSCCQAPWF